MGSSFTEFRGRGFWARDSCLEVWLFLLSREIEHLEAPPAWLARAGAFWRESAQSGMNGWLCADLDAILLDEGRVDGALQVCEKTLARLRVQGPIISRETLNGFGCGGPGAMWMSDRPTTLFVEIGEAFMRLLVGRLEWDAANSPTLPTLPSSDATEVPEGGYKDT